MVCCSIQADGQSVKLNNKIMVSSWMGDPIDCNSSWIIFPGGIFLNIHFDFLEKLPPGKKIQVEKFAYFTSFGF